MISRHIIITRLCLGDLITCIACVNDFITCDQIALIANDIILRIQNVGFLYPTIIGLFTVAWFSCFHWHGVFLLVLCTE